MSGSAALSWGLAIPTCQFREREQRLRLSIFSIVVLMHSGSVANPRNLMLMWATHAPMKEKTISRLHVCRNEYPKPFKNRTRKIVRCSFSCLFPFFFEWPCLALPGLFLFSHFMQLPCCARLKIKKAFGLGRSVALLCWLGFRGLDCLGLRIAPFHPPAALRFLSFSVLYVDRGPWEKYWRVVPIFGFGGCWLLGEVLWFRFALLGRG